jgi:MFS family permease
MEEDLRWRIAILISAAIAISYLDRQTLPVAVKAISADIPLTNVQFSALQSAFLFAYALMYAGGGKLVDILGTNRGFTVIMLFWSLACASHAFATSFMLLATSRFRLGVGVGGGYRSSADRCRSRLHQLAVDIRFHWGIGFSVGCMVEVLLRLSSARFEPR